MVDVSTVNLDAAELDRQFAIDDILRIVDAARDYPVVEIANAHGTASIALHGAQVLTFQPHGQDPVLWVSRDAIYTAGVSVRGGIPICWPWFGVHPDPAMPSHGFVRNRFWVLRSAKQLPDDSTEVVLSLTDDERTLSLWPRPFKLQLTVVIGTTLSLSLMMENRSPEAVEISAALHSYFKVADISKTAISGLDGVDYLDALQNLQRFSQQGLVRVDAELDRIYQQTSGDESIHDFGRQRTIRLQTRRSQSTVVWNPWVAKSATMDDFEVEGYRQMICVETAKVGSDLIELAPWSSCSFGVDISSAVRSRDGSVEPS